MGGFSYLKNYMKQFEKIPEGIVTTAHCLDCGPDCPYCRMSPWPRDEGASAPAAELNGESVGRAWIIAWYVGVLAAAIGAGVTLNSQ